MLTSRLPRRARGRAAERGMTIIELMVGLAIVAIVLFVAVPAFTIFLQNQQIKNAAQTVMQGLNTARAEAIRRNQAVRFQFVSNLTAGCALSTTSLAWVVSLANPAGNCDADAGDMGAAAQVIEKRSATEGTRNVAIATTGGTTATFNGLGRLTGAGITQIDFSNVTGTCEHLSASGKMRCMRVQIAPGGEARMCHPKVAVPVPPAIDPRAC